MRSPQLKKELAALSKAYESLSLHVAQINAELYAVKVKQDRLKEKLTK